MLCSLFADHLFVLVPDVVLVMLSEFMVDWIKHAFITKFNEISFEVRYFFKLRSKIKYAFVINIFFCNQDKFPEYPLRCFPKLKLKMK